MVMNVVHDNVVGIDFAGWAQPLILDRLSEVYYRAHPGNHLRAATLVALHHRAWQAMLRGEHDQGAAVRKELLKAIDRASLSRGDVTRADKAVLEELYIVVRSRFRASRHLSAAYLRPLRNAMDHLDETKLAA